MTDAVTLPAHAKVNLFLRVLAREQDGHHGLETLFCRLGLADELTAERRDGEGVTLEVSGADTGPAAENLAVRAAALVLRALRTPFAVHLRLVKRIPVGAGLGGGSADAAAALHAVNRLAGNAVPRAELLQLAARLGADVPFLFTEASLALAWGHGQRLLVVPRLPRAPVLVVVPPVAISTAEAYGWLDHAQQTGTRRGGVALDLESLSTWGSIARMAGNDFEVPVFTRAPEVRAAFDALVATGPLLCRMTGSGSAIFAVYRSERDREDAALALGRRYGQVIRSETM
jgi:4-diphosphocytidyl-2-C-methyl-D-erythritol kinase